MTAEKIVISNARGPVGPDASPGGSDGNVQFNDGGAFGGATGLTFDGGAITKASLDGSAPATNDPALYVHQTFNGTNADTFVLARFKATDTGSHSGSSLLTLEKDSTVVHNFQKDGKYTISQNTTLGNFGGISSVGNSGEMALTSGIDSGSGGPAAVFNWYWENGVDGSGIASNGVSVLRGVGTNRTSIESAAAMTHIADAGRFEWEGFSGTRLQFVGYEKATAEGRTFDFNNNGQSPTRASPVMSISTQNAADDALHISRISGGGWTMLAKFDGLGNLYTPAIDLPEGVPANPAADVARLYSKDNGSGTTVVAYRTSAGTETVLLGSTAIGVTVQAYSANLATYAGIAPSANVQTLLGAANYAAIRTQLSLTIGTDVQAYSANLTTFAGIAPSSNVQSILGAANYAAVKTLLALGSSDTPTFAGAVAAGATTTAPAFSAQINGDSVPRAKLGLDSADASYLGFGPGSGAQDTILTRDTTGVLALRNGTTNAQSLRLYRTYTDASNYEFGALAWNGNNFRIGTTAAGTGTGRNIYLDPAGGLIGLGGLTSSFPALKRSTTEVQFRLGDDSGYADGSMRKLALNPANDTNGLNISGSSVTSAGTTALVSLAQTLNTSGDYAGIIVANVTNTASGAGSKLFDFQVGGVSKVWSTLAGVLTVQGVTAGSGGVSTSGSVVSSGGNVQSSGVANPTVILKSSTTTGKPGLELQNSSAIAVAKFNVDLNSGDNYIGIAGGSGYFLTFHYNSGTEGMRLTTGGLFGIGCTPTEKLQVAGNIAFSVDNTYSLGTAALRSSVVYSGTGTINTSDARAKRDVSAIPDAWLDAWSDVEWQRYRFIDAYEEKGEDARWHLGMVAQQVHAAFEAKGLDAFAIGLCCYDQWDAVAKVEAKDAVLDNKGNVIEPPVEGRPGIAAGDRWGLRYSECFAIEAAWQRRKLAQLEAMIEAMAS